LIWEVSLFNEKGLKKTKKKRKRGRERTWMLAVEGSSEIQGQQKQRFWVLFFHSIIVSVF